LTPTNFNTILVLAGIIFNAGGIAWLALNHFKTVEKKLDAIEERLSNLEQVVSFINGRCSSMHEEDEE
jgi:hypothetical protein